MISQWRRTHRVFLLGLVFILGGERGGVSWNRIWGLAGNCLCTPLPAQPWLRIGMFVDVLSGPKTWKSGRVLHVSPDGKLCIVRYTDSPNVDRNVDIKDRIRATPETFTLYNATRLDDASMAPGSPVTGVITNLKPYAAFVDISSEKEAVLGFTEANLSDLRVGQEVECEIATKRAGRWQLAPKGTFVVEEVALHRFHTQGPKAGWLPGSVVGAERYCLYVNVEAPGLSHTVWGEVHADQIRDGYVGDARLEHKVGDEVRVRVLEVGVSENKGYLVPYFGVLIGSILQFRVLY